MNCTDQFWQANIFFELFKTQFWRVKLSLRIGLVGRFYNSCQIYFHSHHKLCLNYMSNLPYKLWLFLPFIFTHYVSGQWPVTPGPSEGAGQTQITLPSTYDRIDIIDPPRDDAGNVVGTFLATDNLQSTTSGNTFYFTANSDDFYGHVYIDWNGTDATGTTSHTLSK